MRTSNDWILGIRLLLMTLSLDSFGLTFFAWVRAPIFFIIIFFSFYLIFLNIFFVILWGCWTIRGTINCQCFWYVFSWQMFMFEVEDGPTSSSCGGLRPRYLCFCICICLFVLVYFYLFICICLFLLLCFFVYL